MLCVRACVRAGGRSGGRACECAALTLRGGERAPNDRVMEQEAQETAELQASLASTPYAGEFVGPEVWVEEDHSHK